MSKKVETMEEFFARGGKVKQLEIRESASPEKYDARNLLTINGRRHFIENGKKKEFLHKWNENKEFASKFKKRFKKQYTEGSDNEA